MVKARRLSRLLAKTSSADLGTVLEPPQADNGLAPQKEVCHSKLGMTSEPEYSEAEPITALSLKLHSKSSEQNGTAASQAERSERVVDVPAASRSSLPRPPPAAEQVERASHGRLRQELSVETTACRLVSQELSEQRATNEKLQSSCAQIN